MREALLAARVAMSGALSAAACVAVLRRWRLWSGKALLCAVTYVVTALLCAGAAWSQTLPVGGTVASGKVSIGTSGHGSGNPNNLVIDQTSQSAIVNWQSFSIGANGTVNIVQPNASSALLNRVTGNAASILAGHLDANGQVFLINPNGIAITKSGVVDVGGGFVASTLGISDDDFKSGKLSFTGTGSSAGVTNQGVVTVGRGGYAALLGGRVNNAGLIAVPLGKVGLGSGEAATLDVSGDGFLQVAVPTVFGLGNGAQSSATQRGIQGSGPQFSGTGSSKQGSGPKFTGTQGSGKQGSEPQSIGNQSNGEQGTAAGGRGAGSALIQSSGTISAEGGTVILSAATARAAARNAINLSGVIEAHSISGHDGAISLSGGPGGTVNVSGTLDVSGERSGGPLGDVRVGSRGESQPVDGGTIAVTGEHIALAGATLNASGASGGTIDIGWDEHGAGPLPSAETLSVDAATLIVADAQGMGTAQDGLGPYAGVTANLGTFGNSNASSGSSGSRASTGSVDGPGSGSGTGNGNGNGNGGSVVLWSEEDTRFAGKISATGAQGGGNGGDAEVSSKNVLQYSGSVDLKAPHGAFGTLLLDPYNVTIETGSTTGGTFTGGTFTAPSSNSILSVADLQNALANASVTVTTGGASPGSDAGNITVANALTWSTGSTLTLSAYHSIAIDAAITIAGGGGLALTTNNGGSGGTLTFAQAASAQFTGVYNSSNDGGNSALDGTAQGSLTINTSGTAHSYALVNSMTGLAGIGTTSSSYSALAVPLTSSTTYTNAVIPTFAGTFEGLGNTISNLTISSGATNNIGLFGQSTGTIRDLGLIGVNITGSGSNVGGLLGYNYDGGTVANDYTTGTLTVTNNNNNSVGGLVGNNGAAYVSGTYTDTISNSYSTANVVSNAYGIGGLVGQNGCDFVSSCTGHAVLTESYATGAVGGSSANNVGGLIGRDGQTGQVSYVYSTGTVTGGGYVSGLMGYSNGSLTDTYWDKSSSGMSGSSGSSVGLSTANLQNSTNPSGVVLTGFSGGAAGGINNVYPYLSSFYPSGVQAVAGIAYKDVGINALSSTATNLASVSVTINGVAEGSAETGANGYYYLLLPPSTISSSGANVLAYTSANSTTGAVNADNFTSATGTVSGLNIYGGFSGANLTSAVLYSQLGGVSNTNSGALYTAITGYSTTPSFVANLPALIVATGSSFTFDETLDLNSSFYLATSTTNAPITVAAPITLEGANALSMSAAGTLAVNSNITVPSTGTLSLNYNSASAANLTFAQGASVKFTGVYNSSNDGGSSALDGTATGTLTVNATAYTLVNSMVELDGIDGTAASTTSAPQYGAGLAGNYALANALTATGTSYTNALVGTNSSGNSTTEFSGRFEGLGNSITGLSIAKTTASGNYAGLFGYVGSAGTVRDLGLVNATVSGTSRVGVLVGEDLGTVANVYNSGTVTASATSSSYIGGLVGELDAGTVTQSYSTSIVSTGNSATRVGGLLGDVDSGSSISSVFAMGPVSVGTNSTYVGGLSGYQVSATMTQAYATGAVTSGTGSSSVGGLAGIVVGGTTTQSYWDKTTSGQTSSSAGTGLTTAQLQGTSSLPNGTTMSLTAFSGGAAGTTDGGATGEYPFLTNFFPSGVQVISGSAYKSGGTASPLASIAAGAASVSIASGGAVVGTASTGNNGYYYLFLPATTLAAGAGIVSYTQTSGTTGAANAASFTQIAGSTGITNLNVYGGWELDQPASGITSLSALSSAISGAVGATAPSAFSLANREIDAAGAFTLDQSVNVSGTLALSSSGAVSETGGAALSAANLLLAGSGGSYTLGNANSIGTLAASTGSVSLVDTASLTTGSLNGAAGAVTTGVTTTGTVSLISSGSLTIASGDTVSGQSPVLAAAGAFINDQGADAVTATSSTRWLIYSSSPSADTFDALNSANTAIFDATYSSLAPGSVTQGGNRYLFANQPTLTVTSTSDTKTYGVDDSSSIAGDYTLSGSFPSVSGVFLADSMGNAVSGAPAVSSSGSSATAPVIGSPYVIDVAQGTLSSSSGYGFTYVNSGSLTVNPVIINLTGTRVYDANTDAAASVFESNGSIAGVAGQLLTLSGTGTLAGKNVGNETFSSLGTLTLGNGGSGGTAGVATNYTLVGGTDAVNVTALGITVTATANNKPYDTTTAATVTLASSGVLGSDQVSFSDTSATFSDANAATGKTVTVSGLGLGGTDGGNYTISNANATATTTANIAPAIINLSGTRVYDANTDAAASLFESNGSIAGVAGQLLTLSGTGTLAGKNVGSESLTSLGTLTLGNGGSSGTAGVATNYTLVGGTDAVNVTALGITVSATAANKVYDATNAATVTLSSSGVLGNDQVTFSDTSATFNNANAGNGKTVTVSGISTSGTDGGNYTISNANDLANTMANISPAVINLSGTRVYDANTDAAASVFESNGSIAGVAGQLLTLTGSATLAGKNVGSESLTSLGTLTLSNGGSGGTAGVATNYTLLGGTDAVNVTPLGITVTATADNKPYDTTTAATVSLSSSGVLGNDQVTFIDTSATFNNANAGNGKTVTVSGISTSGTDGGNYTISNANDLATTTANISPAVINLSGTRVYDANTDAAASVFESNGSIAGLAGQLLTLSGTGTLAGKNVGNEAVTALGTLTLGNGGSGGTAGVASNYTLVGGTDAVNVTPLGITVSATAANKVYDASNTATVSLASSGVLQGDSVSFSDTSASFSNANVGNGKIVTVSGISATGTDSGNYTISNANAAATTMANITPATITVAGATGVNKIYDGTTTLPAGASGFIATGIYSSDAGDITVEAARAVYSNAAVGTETVNVSGLTLSGSAAGNYVLSSQTATGSGTISAASGGGSAGGSSGGPGSGSGGKSSGNGNGGKPSGSVTLSPFAVDGAGGYALAGKVTGPSHDGGTSTVVGTLSNGSVTFIGTFVIYARSRAGNGPLPDEIAANGSEIVTFVPGTLTEELAGDSGIGFASLADSAAWSEDGHPIDAMPFVYSTQGDPTTGEMAVATIGSPAFDLAIACIKDGCRVANGSAERNPGNRNIGR
jgi:filamentous hemagglutinin family protein